MIKLKKILESESGQMMLIAVLLAVMLLIAIPTVIYINQQHGRQSVYTQKSQEAFQGSQEAVANIAGALSNDATWALASAGNFGGISACGAAYKTSKGVDLNVFCNKLAPAQDYEVRIDVKTVATEKDPARSLWMLLSKKTVGVALPNNLTASAAVALYNPPIYTMAGTGILDVHWGPIVERGNTNTWRIKDTLESGRYPRKFSAGAIDSVTAGPPFIHALDPAGPASDQKEYWAWSSLGFDPLIDNVYYSNTAKALAAVPPPTIGTQLPLNSGYFPNDTTFTDNAGAPYTITQAPLFVNGTAYFGNVAMDLKGAPGGGSAFVVAGDLLLEPNALGGQVLSDLRVPIQAKQEYPFLASGTPPNFPCSDAVGSSCRSDTTGLPRTKVDFRGFLYVKHDLMVKIGAHFLIVGALRVDGQLYIDPGASLTVLYDDQINQQIHATPFQLQLSNCVANIGDACGTCGGIIQCDGSCYPNSSLATTPCFSANNACGAHTGGFIGCSGRCEDGFGNLLQPPLLAVTNPNYHTTCQSPPSPICGKTNTGWLNCSNVCADANNVPLPSAGEPSLYNTGCLTNNNHCGDHASGILACDEVTCSVPPPPDPAGFGTPCTTVSNVCGANSGLYKCNATHDGVVCDVLPPDTPQTPCPTGSPCMTTSCGAGTISDACLCTCEPTSGSGTTPDCKACAIDCDCASGDCGSDGKCAPTSETCGCGDTGTSSCTGNTLTCSVSSTGTGANCTDSCANDCDCASGKCDSSVTGKCVASTAGVPCGCGNTGRYACDGTCAGETTSFTVGDDCNPNFCGTFGGTITDACTGSCSGPVPADPRQDCSRLCAGDSAGGEYYGKTSCSNPTDDSTCDAVIGGQMDYTESNQTNIDGFCSCDSANGKHSGPLSCHANILTGYHFYGPGCNPPYCDNSCNCVCTPMGAGGECDPCTKDCDCTSLKCQDGFCSPASGGLDSCSPATSSCQCALGAVFDSGLGECMDPSQVPGAQCGYVYDQNNQVNNCPWACCSGSFYTNITDPSTFLFGFNGCCWDGNSCTAYTCSNTSVCTDAANQCSGFCSSLSDFMCLTCLSYYGYYAPFMATCVVNPSVSYCN